MDSGLGVRWPLSPYATALAAGALFAFCLALWKHRIGARKRAGKDPKGQNFGKDLDPPKEQDVPEKPGKKKNEEEADKTKNFPVLTVRDARRAFSYEQLCVSGQFGAIPRTTQRRQTLENPNLYSAFRRRNVKKENKNWPEFNPASSNFSYIYQQPFCFGSEFPRLSAKLLFNFPPNLHTYINQIRELPVPGISRKSSFDDFDVSIKPEILKNKPITRSAVCLALQRQLHKYLEEPFHEVKFIERAIQTAEEEGNRTPAEENNERDLNFDSDSFENAGLQSDRTESDKKASSDSSLWDSGYGEKAFEERSKTPKEHDKDEILEECSAALSTETSIISDSFVSYNHSSDNLLATSDSNILGLNTCPELTDKSNSQTNELDFESDNTEIPDEEIKNSTDAESVNTSRVSECLDEKLPKCSGEVQMSCSKENILRDTDNAPDIHLDSDRESVVLSADVNSAKSKMQQPIENLILGSSDLGLDSVLIDEPNIQINELDFESENSKIPDEEIKNSTFAENVNTLRVSECLGKKLPKSSEEIHMSYSEENILEFESGNAEIRDEEIKNSTFAENVNTLCVSECLGEKLSKCSEEIQMSYSEENIIRDADNAPDSDHESVVPSTAVSSAKSKMQQPIENMILGSSDLGLDSVLIEEPNIRTIELDFESENAKIPDEEIKNSTFAENVNSLCVSECLDEKLPKYSEEIQMSGNEKNILDFESGNAEIPDEEIKNSTFAENANTLRGSECLDENFSKCSEEIQMSYSEENILRDTDNAPEIHLDSDHESVVANATVNFAKSKMQQPIENLILGSADLGLDSVLIDEPNIQTIDLDFESENAKIPDEEIKNASFSENANTLCAEECLDEKLPKCSEEIHMSFSEENILDFESGNGEIPDEDIKNSTFVENVNTLRVSGCSDEKLPKCSEEIQMSCREENIFRDTDNAPDIHLDSDRESVVASAAVNSAKSKMQQPIENLTFGSSDLEEFQNTFPIFSGERQESRDDENLFRDLENMTIDEKNLDSPTRASEVDAGGGDSTEESSIKKRPDVNLENSGLEGIQNAFDSAEERNNAALSPVLREAELSSQKRNSRPTKTTSDVTEGGASRDSVFDERGTSNEPRQMDRETGERSVAVESTVTTETTFRANGDARLSTAVVSRLTLDDWSSSGVSERGEDQVSVRTSVSEDVFRPTFEEFVPLKSSEKISKSEGESLEAFVPLASRNGTDEKKFEVLSEGDESESPSSPRVDRLKGLLNRDEERRSRTKFHHLADGSHVGGAMEGEWDRLLRDVLASVSELERWERRHCDVSSDAEDAEQQRQHPFSQSDSSFAMEEEALSPKGETPTKVKNLRFKLDPDVFDVPSDDSFYDDDDDDTRRVWKKQSKYRAFSSLELHDEPVRLVSVHASVVPAGQKMVARPVGIDLRVRLTEERQSKRAHVSTSPSQAKRRSPVSDRGIGWCQELSPVTENVDWRETFTPVTPECKSVPNGILKTPSPKTEPSPIESPNPFKLENGVTTNGVSPVIENGKSIEKPKYNGWKPIERKPFLLPRKKFEPDPEAVERITGYKSALSKPPLPPPIPSKLNASLIVRNRAELARKQYLDSKAALAANKMDGTKKFQQFLNQAQNDRARIITSVPDLAAIERAVTEQWTKERGSVSPRESPGREDNKKNDGVTLSRGSTPDDKWASYVQSCRQHLGRRSQSMTYLETDIDIIPVLDEDDKCHSTSALDEPDEALPDPDDSDLDRSREDLDDSGRAKSEHELRIERSLRSLPIPEWYRRSEKTKTGFLLGSSNKEKRGWAAAKSLASSTSSLASCGLRRPVRSLRSSRENIPWSRSSASPDGPTLSLALAKAFREPYLGWRARTPTSSGVSSSPRASPPSWGATTTDDEANGVSFDGEDAFGRTTSSEEDRRDEPLSLDDTGADAVTVSMDTNDPVKLPGGEDTCDDINNMSMDTCELFDASVVVPVDEDPSPQADTGDDIDNLSTDTTTTEGRKLDPKLKRYSYSQSIYHSEWDEDEESRGDRKGKEEDREPSPASPDHKVVWIESSFVGSRTTTSIVVMPEKRAPGSTQERPASR